MEGVRGDWLKIFATIVIWQVIFVMPRNNGKFLGTCALIFGL